jgi:hypothetical protein
LRYLPLAAWAVFLLDVVVLLQLLYTWLLHRGRPGFDAEAEAALRGLVAMLGPALAGIAVLLIVSTWLRSRAGLWIALALGSVPLFFAVNAIIEGMWR